LITFIKHPIFFSVEILSNGLYCFLFVQSSCSSGAIVGAVASRELTAKNACDRKVCENQTLLCDAQQKASPLYITYFRHHLILLLPFTFSFHFHFGTFISLFFLSRMRLSCPHLLLSTSNNSCHRRNYSTTTMGLLLNATVLSLARSIYSPSEPSRPNRDCTATTVMLRVV
jgi:hypothetical protein